MKRNPTTLLLLTCLVAFGVASAEDDLTSLSYISYMERYATVQPAAQDQSMEAVINLPLVAGDRLDTAREARVEVVLPDGTLLWLDEYTTLSFDSVALSRETNSDRTVLYLAEGQVLLELREPAPGTQAMRIDSGPDTVYLTSAGVYRLQTLRAGGLRVEVWSGLAEVSTAAGGVLVRSGYAAEVSGGGLAGPELAGEARDSFAFWVDQRRQWAQGESSPYVDNRHARDAANLDNYGTWVYLESNNSWAWQPAVSSSWRPYTAGRWYWTPVGWSWVSYEPWGWLPYHYGSWYMHAGYGWVWTWDYYWSPAWVHWMWYPGYVGWCPVGYYGHYWDDHWYGHHGGGHPGHPGGGSGAPSRRNVVPGRTSALAAPGGAQPASGRTALDLRGRTNVGAVDRTPWNVVATDDFASPHVARLVKPGEVAFRGRDDAEAVVASGALRTVAPGRVSAARELETAFTGIQRQGAPDLSPLLARDASLSAERGMQLARPSSAAELSRAVVGSDAARNLSTVMSPRLPTARDAAIDRSTHHTAPNLYRPVLGTQPEAMDSVSGRSQPPLGGRALVTPSSGALGRSGSSSGSSSDGRALGQPRESTGTSRSAPLSTRPLVVPRSSTAAPRTSSSTDRGSAPSSTSPRSITPPSTTSSSRPIVVPSSSGSTTRSSSATAPSSSSSRSARSTSSVSRSSSSSSRSSSSSSSSSSRSSSSRSSSSSSTVKKR